MSVSYYVLKLWQFMLQSPLAHTSGDCAPPVLTREGGKRVRYIQDLQMAPTNPYFRKQGKTLANFMLCYQKIFVPIRFCH